MNIKNYFIPLIALVSITSLMQAMENPKANQPNNQLECVRENMREALRQGFRMEHPIGEDEDAITPLMMAVSYLHDSEQVVNRVRVLLEYGANARAKTSDGDTPLHMIASEDCDEVNDWGVTIDDKEQVLKNYKIIDLLVDHGASIEQLNDSNETPLMKAVKQKRLDVVKSLLLHGASTKWVWSWRNKPDDQLSLQEKAGKNIIESLEVSRRSSVSIIDFNIYQYLMHPTFELKSNDYMSETLFEQKQTLQKQVRKEAKIQLRVEKCKSIFDIIKNREIGSKKYQARARKRKQNDRDEENLDTREPKRRRLTFEG